MRKSGAAEAIVADAVMRSLEDDDTAPRPVPLDLAPLIAPYRKHGRRLSVRVERLPPRARLTRGHNNGDRSWSLMSDELDGLAYLPPKGTAELCTLGIRIVSLDGGDGGTLALIDYPISSTGSSAAPVVAERPAPTRRAFEQDDGELRRLREELAGAKAVLAEREAEMVATRGRFEKELQDQLAASSKLAAEMLERDRTQKQQSGDVAKAENDWRAAEAARIAAAETRGEARGAKALAEAHAQLERSRAESQSGQKQTAGEATRIAAAEARGEARAEARAATALADAQAQLDRARTRSSADSARDRSDEAERKRLRDEVQRLKKSLAAREDELAKSRESWQRDSEAKLAKAEGAWRDHESQTLSDARTQWQERSERALAEAKAQFERAQSRAESDAATRNRDLESEAERLADKLAAANSAIADRETDIADIQARLDEQIAHAETLSGQEAENRRLKAEIAQGQRALLQARAEMEQAKADWRAQSDATLAARLAEWKKDEAARILAAETQAQDQAQIQLSRAAKRAKELEAERDQLRAHAEALQKRGDSEDIKQLRREFGHLQAHLAERELEVAQLKLDSEHARERWTAEARISLQKAEHEWKVEADAAEREERKALGTRRTVRDVALVGAVSALAMMLYLKIDDGTATTLIPGPLTNWMTPSIRQAALPAPKTGEQPAAHMVTILKSANVRSGPSKTADIVTTLPRNTELASLEHHGNWVRVKLTGAKAQDGWVFATYLSDKPAPVHP